MECYVCKKTVKDGQSMQRLSEEKIRHQHCAPLTKNFVTAFPEAWSNKYYKPKDGDPPEPEPIKRRMLKRKKKVLKRRKA